MERAESPAGSSFGRVNSGVLIYLLYTLCTHVLLKVPRINCGSTSHWTAGFQAHTLNLTSMLFGEVLPAARFSGSGCKVTFTGACPKILGPWYTVGGPPPL